MSDVDDLRGRAEALVGGELREFHELRVHQVELQLQNEELRRMHLELSRSRARYFDLYDLAPVGYFSVSQHGQILDANHTASTALGVPRSAVIARPFTQFIAPEDQDLYYLLRKRLDASGAPQSVELRLLKGDGSHFWAHVATAAATDEDGVHVARMAISDVSERKRAEGARAELEERLGAVLDTAHEVIITVDAAGLVTEWNRQAETVFGWTRQEATGHHLSDLIMAERYRSEQHESLQLAVQGGHRSRHTRSELHAVRRSGEELLMEFTVSAMPVRGAMFYSAFMTDLTKQRATEQAKLRLEAQLQQAQRLESVGRLAGGVAHDTNNMLGVIEGLAEIVADDVGPSHASQRDLAQIRETF
jgi:PAS domain S-box-containing protein